MRQIFFIPNGQQLPQVFGATFHVWKSDGGESIGVAHMDGNCDAEQVIAQLEAQGIEWLPNHHNGSEKIAPHHAKKLAKLGVSEADTTFEAMNKVHAAAGFSPLKPRRF